MQISSNRDHLLQWYYLGTPGFLLLDIIWDINFRVSFLSELPGLKYSYYAGCFACGFIAFSWPKSSAVIGLFESAGNMLILILSIMLPIYQAAEAVADGGAIHNPMTTEKIANFLVTGSILVICFYRNPLFRYGAVKK